MRRSAVVAAVVACAAVGALPGLARADDPLAGTRVVFARGGSLWQTDARGKTETELVSLPRMAPVRALRTDASGAVLLVDLGGKWYWMPLGGGAATLTELACADGPAQLATDGRCVLCRSAARPGGSAIINLGSARSTAVAIPTPGARLVGSNVPGNNGRRLVWADAAGVWSAPPGDPSARTKVAPEAPLRNLLPSPDGTRAVGVYADSVYEGRTKVPAEILMGFSLDGNGGRRKGIRNGVPVEWSHDNRWVLVQDGSTACIMQATGGEYKCWRGYTAASIAPDGSYALLLGNREAAPTKAASKGKGGKGKGGKGKGKQAAASSEPEGEPEQAVDAGDVADDVAVAPPTGPLALYRAQLNGPYTTAPQRIVTLVDGAAVWVPTPSAP